MSKRARAPWWRRLSWLYRGGPDRLEIARLRRLIGVQQPHATWRQRQNVAKVILDLRAFAKVAGNDAARALLEEELGLKT